MIITALSYQEGLPCRTIEQLSYCEKDQKVRGRFAGQVLKVSKDDKFVSFVVSDGSATAEVSLLHKRVKNEDILPKKGQSVEIIGVGFKKTFGGKNQYSFLKIIALSIGAISLEEQFEINIKAIKTLSQRTIEGASIERTQKIKPLYTRKSFQTVSQQLEIRTLIMIYCYYVLEHNSDIQSYIFDAEMIRASKHGKQFMQTYGVTKDCVEQIITKTLVQLCIAGFIFQRIIIEKKDKQQQIKRQFFLIKRDLFRGIQKTIEEKIIMEKNTGIKIDQLTSYSNKKISQFSNVNYQIFNLKLIQIILSKLQGVGLIYKTSDKLIFPNIRD